MCFNVILELLIIVIVWISKLEIENKRFKNEEYFNKFNMFVWYSCTNSNLIIITSNETFAFLFLNLASVLCKYFVYNCDCVNKIIRSKYLIFIGFVKYVMSIATNE